MPPPGTGKPSLTVAVAVPKPGAGRMPPPGTSKSNGAAPGAKASPEEALVVREGHQCSDCANWQDGGSCTKVDGQFAPGDACLRYFKAMGMADDEPDADDQGGPPDMDADDSGAPAGAQ
jgi:hypothetical protein